ncbi:MAG: UDP-N-acetylmuramate dehydrogenase [Planctomycetota bacterium]|jgi:UDP-N-acetylmuramate dehydrogenase
MNDTIKQLTDLNVGQLRSDVSLAEHCTWKIGGPADVMVEPERVEQFVALRQFLNERNIPSLTIGEGSNLLFDDAGFRGVVVKIGRRFADVTIDGVQVSVQAGASAARLARTCGVAGLSGLEHIVGIPGTLGGLVAMNGGSLRQSIGDVVCTVEAMDAQGSLKTFERPACGFNYRKSAFQGTDWLVLEAVLSLKQGDPAAICADMLAILRERRQKFPRRLPSCGSVFLSTTQMHQTIGPPGKVIEDAGLKGRRVGDAQVSSQHANFIINTGRATAADICELVKIVRDTVHKQTNFRLKCEARKVSPTGHIQPLHEIVD